jgi:pullulanase/glycogen debranching enzyme
MNGKYRDTMRDFWRSHPVGIGEFASRFCGSSDMYGRARRRPTASVNLITVHDGFTLRDLVSYNGKHNEANGENNNDGTSDNRSWNCGAEGETDDPAVLALRSRQSRAMLATLLLSFGIPMLLGGDEMGRTQQGNNNAYCQDNEITWFDWSQPDTGLLAFTRQLIALRKAHPVFRRVQLQACRSANGVLYHRRTRPGIRSGRTLIPSRGVQSHPAVSQPAVASPPGTGTACVCQRCCMRQAAVATHGTVRIFDRPPPAPSAVVCYLCPLKRPVGQPTLSTMMAI